MEIATAVNKGLHYGLIFDVIKYSTDECDHFMVNHIHDLLPKRLNSVRQ
jgi:hypothetical protein